MELPPGTMGVFITHTHADGSSRQEVWLVSDATPVPAMLRVMTQGGHDPRGKYLIETRPHGDGNRWVTLAELEELMRIERRRVELEAERARLIVRAASSVLP